MDGNIHNLQDAMEWLDRRIREEAELNGEMSNEHAIQLGFIQNMLTKFPRRNCDVGTVEEQIARFNAFCDQRSCKGCELPVYGCRFAWAQMPYKEGGAE